MKKIFASLMLLAFCMLANAQIISPYAYYGDHPNAKGEMQVDLAPYPDVTTVQPVLSAMPANLQTVSWAFVGGTCDLESWSGTSGDTFAATNIPAWAASSKHYFVTTGGAADTFYCSSPAGYIAFAKKYCSNSNCKGIDHDIEGLAGTGGQFQATITGDQLKYTGGVQPSVGSVILSPNVPPGTEIVSGTSPNFQLNNSIAKPLNGTFFGSLPARYTQAQVNSIVGGAMAAQAVYPNLHVTFTVGGYGGSAAWLSLGSHGVYVINAIRQLGLKNWDINVMVGDSVNDPAHCIQVNGECEMGLTGIQIAKNLNAYFNVPFNQIALTPMIGKNDVAAQTFTLNDAIILGQFAAASKLYAIHPWDLGRDRDCDTSIPASDQCNSYNLAGTLGFVRVLLAATGQ